jgi:hypothetical protein
MDETTFASRIANLDPGLFKITAQLSPGDRRSLLAVQNAVRLANNDYVYLECGSHLGGSLLPYVLDPHCRIAYSIDKRPPVQADERGIDFRYDSNQTRQMLDLLAAHAPARSVAKVKTFDMDASALTAAQVVEKPDLVLIDAEHTVVAVFRDFLNLWRLSGTSAVHVFHDANLIFAGLQNIETFLRHSGVPFDSYVLPDSIFVVATHDAREIVRAAGRRFAVDKERYWENAKRQLMQTHYDIVRDQMAASKSAQMQRARLAMYQDAIEAAIHRSEPKRRVRRK